MMENGQTGTSQSKIGKCKENVCQIYEKCKLTSLSDLII